MGRSYFVDNKACTIKHWFQPLGRSQLVPDLYSQMLPLSCTCCYPLPGKTKWCKTCTIRSIKENSHRTRGIDKVVTLHKYCMPVCRYTHPCWFWCLFRAPSNVEKGKSKKTIRAIKFAKREFHSLLNNIHKLQYATTMRFQIKVCSTTIDQIRLDRKLVYIV